MSDPYTEEEWQNLLDDFDTWRTEHPDEYEQALAEERVRPAANDTSRPVPRSARSDAGSTRAWRQRRAWWAARFAAGLVVACTRCGEPVCHGMRWDLDHYADDDNDHNTAPAHQKCNRSSGGTYGNERKSTVHHRPGTKPQVEADFFGAGSPGLRPVRRALSPPRSPVPSWKESG